MEQPERLSTIVAREDAHPGVAVAELFVAAFPHHPLSQLGPTLAGAFLRALAQRAVLVVARDPASGSVLGFALGGDPAQMEIARRAFIRKYAIPIFAASLAHGSTMRILRPRLRAAKHTGMPRRTGYQLRLIAVSSGARGMGVGSDLLAAFEDSLPPHCSYHAWTLAGAPAEAFYLRHGFQRDALIEGHVRYVKRKTA